MQQLDVKQMPCPLPFPPVEIALQSEETAVRDALGRLLVALDPLELDVEEAGTVELVLAEALNNIVEHAYPTGSRGPIWIKCKHRRDGLHLRIVDEGEMMPDGQLPIGMAQDVDVDVMDLPDGGFGWFLIKDLAKDVTYHRIGQLNQLELRLAVAIPSPDAPLGRKST